MPFSARQSEIEVFGLRCYLETARKNPRKAAEEIGCMILLFALLFAALYLKEILRWIEGVM